MSSNPPFISQAMANLERNQQQRQWRAQLRQGQWSATSSDGATPPLVAKKRDKRTAQRARAEAKLQAKAAACAAAAACAPAHDTWTAEELAEDLSEVVAAPADDPAEVAYVFCVSIVVVYFTSRIGAVKEGVDRILRYGSSFAFQFRLFFP